MTDNVTLKQRKMKRFIFLLPVCFPYNIFAQGYYMHEAAEDSQDLISGVLGLALIFGVIYVIRKIIASFEEQKRIVKETAEKRKQEIKLEEQKKQKEIRDRQEKIREKAQEDKTAELYGSWISSKYMGVDLGLSVNWSPLNLGALEAYEYGDYYSWGESEKFSSTDGLQLLYEECLNIGGDIRYDAATKRIGLGWRLPTNSEVEEIISKCAWVKTTQDGVKGYLVIGPNEKTIFLPCAGSRSNIDYKPHVSINKDGRYWTAEAHKDDFKARRAHYFGFEYEGILPEPRLSHAFRHPKFSIRPIYDKNLK